MRQLLMQDQARSGAVDALDVHLCNSEHQLSSVVTQRLYSGDLATTQSRIASFLKCPFSYFCNYTLHLEGEKKGEFDHFSMGTFVHAILEAFFMKAREWKKDIHAIDEHEQEKILDSILPFVIKDAIPAEELTNPRTAFLLNSLVAKTKIIIASMCEELSHSAFEPAFFELKIAPGNSIAPPPVSFTAEDGSRVYVYGTIDRVDKLVINGNVYVRVVDYKTGSATITQNSVRKGDDLQMPLYLFSLLGAQNSQFRTKLGAKNGEIIPAGVMYMSSLMDESDSENQFVRSGLFLYDETVLHAMDDTPDSQYISIKRTKQGKITAASQKRLLTQEGFQTLLQDMGELLTGIATRIKHGDATASPMKATGAYSTCSTCAYKPICRHVTRPKEDEDTSEE
jgi:ATP-dependent helicase/nuclease subunit B